MSPKPDPAQVTILSSSRAKEQVTYLSASATGYPNQVRFMSPSGPHTVSFPTGVFDKKAKTAKVGGNAVPPDPVLTLEQHQPEPTDQGYPYYIDAKVQVKIRRTSKPGPPIIIVKP